MSQPIETIDFSLSIKDVAETLSKNNIGSVIVVGNEVLGIITETDIIDAISENKDIDALKAKDIMSSPLITIHPLKKVEECVEKMKENNIKKIAVENQGKLLGMVTTKDISLHSPEMASQVYLSKIKKRRYKKK